MDADPRVLVTQPQQMKPNTTSTKKERQGDKQSITLQDKARTSQHAHADFVSAHYRMGAASISQHRLIQYLMVLYCVVQEWNSVLIWQLAVRPYEYILKLRVWHRWPVIKVASGRSFLSTHGETL